MDLYFNNSIYFFAFILVATVVFVSLVILARDIIVFVIRRLRKEEQGPEDRDRDEPTDEEEFR